MHCFVISNTVFAEKITEIQKVELDEGSENNEFIKQSIVRDCREHN